VNSRPVLVLGATGVFGGLACRLLRRHGVRVVAAGRNRARLDALAAELDLTVEAANLPDDLDALLEKHAPALVIDTCGPFQQRDYAMPRACIAHRTHYIDLSDGREDVAAIGSLDRKAREAGIAVIAGASAVPGLSSAVVDALSPHFSSVESIETAIAPGNDAPRGRAVIASILSYLGKPIPRWQDGVWTSVHGWQDMRVVAFEELGRRRVAACDVPDTAIFPLRYPHLRSVSFHAGLELPFYQWSFWLLSWPVRWGLLRDATVLTGPLKFVADVTRRFGTATGGMRVRIDGLGLDARPRRAVWTLVARQGDGPLIPVIPAVALALAILRGNVPEAGARACMGDVALRDIAALFAGHAIEASLTVEAPPSLFRRALGEDFDRLPAAIRSVHELSHDTTLRGRGAVEHGENLLARLAAWLRILPPEGDDFPVAVGFGLAPGRERWRRSFNGHVESSVLSRPGPGFVMERFGPLDVRMDLSVADNGIDFHIGRNRLFGLPLPLPRWLGLSAHAREACDSQGRFTFDVSIDLPLGLRLIRYRGWLAPASAD